MRWFLAALLLCAGSLWAQQSLGDVARAQRDDNDHHPKAQKVFTNADVSDSVDREPVTEPPKPQPSSTKAAPTTQGKPAAKAPAQSEAAQAQNQAQKKRIAELSLRTQMLASQIDELQARIQSLTRATYGDPDRVHQKEEIKQLAAELEVKRSEWATVRDELLEETERASKSSVMK
jgi:predicted RNase H-like nuclease (RuvC/YqgF family)